MLDLPTEIITFLFTDIEGSTTRWEYYPERMKIAIAHHDALLHKIMQTHHGIVFKTVGDAFYVAFSSANEALAAAIEAQCALATAAWDAEISPLRVRMALHTGEAEQRGNDYFGSSLNRVARILSAAHGGQVLLSHTTLGLVHNGQLDGMTFRDLGMHYLKDIQHPVHIFQLIHPDLPIDFPPLKTLKLRPNNLPVQLTPCVGRTEEIAAVSKLVLNPQLRLVTLIGPGGIGKTRLGLQVASHVADSFPTGVWFIELATVPNNEAIGSAILQALGPYKIGQQPILEQLKTRLDGQTLLFFDSIEQVSQGSTFVSQLLDVCPQLKILVTSRLALGLYGEYLYHIVPLAVPDSQQALKYEELLKFGAIELFVQQARITKPGFRLTRSNSHIVTKICKRLDGLPLALELVAARITLLSLHTMLKHLDYQLQLFIASNKPRSVQQQTLLGAIKWSYDLLNVQDKILLNHLSIFKSGCTFAAIEAICLTTEELNFDALTMLKSLTDKSLLRQLEGENGEPRFRVMYIIREYALEQLHSSGQVEELSKRHAEYYLSLVEQIAPTLTGIEQKSSLAILEEEHANIQTALAWYIAQGQIETGLRMAEALGRFWWMHSHILEGRQWLDRLLDSEQAKTASVSLRTQALVMTSRMASSQYDHERATQLANQALLISLNVGDQKNTSLAYTAQAEIAFHRGDYQLATTLLEKSLTILQALGDKRGIASLLNNLGNVALPQGKLDQAARLHEQSLMLFRRLDDAWAIATVLTSLGEVERRRGNYKQADILHKESLKLYRNLGYTEGIATSLVSLGDLARYQGDHIQAENFYKKSLELFRKQGDKIGISVCLQGLAEVAYIQEQLEHATRLFAQAEVTAYATGTTILQYEQTTHSDTIDRLRARLDSGAFEGFWTIGQAMSLEQATIEALGEDVLEE